MSSKHGAYQLIPHTLCSALVHSHFTGALLSVYAQPEIPITTLLFVVYMFIQQRYLECACTLYFNLSSHGWSPKEVVPAGRYSRCTTLLVGRLERQEATPFFADLSYKDDNKCITTNCPLMPIQIIYLFIVLIPHTLCES